MPHYLSIYLYRPIDLTELYIMSINYTSTDMILYTRWKIYAGCFVPFEIWSIDSSIILDTADTTFNRL